MQATAIAQPNIALIKYWGKRDVERNLPAVGSISVTLKDLYTEASVELDAGRSSDCLLVNGQQDDALLPRISRCIDSVAGQRRSAALIETSSNFPIAAGLASSASAFAAVTVAAAAAAGRNLNANELAQLAGSASGSAARSLIGGFAELRNTHDNIEVCSLAAAEDWPLAVIVAITETGPKAIGSTAAMEISRQTSPFYLSWLSQQEADLDTARQAIALRDLAALGSVAEHNCLKMHSVMWASRPPLVYWNAATMRCMQVIRELQGDGCPVFFTIDAGPQLKAICLPEDARHVQKTLAAVDGVRKVMRSDLGPAARLKGAAPK